jgi:hypothetical protein
MNHTSTVIAPKIAKTVEVVNVPRVAIDLDLVHCIRVAQHIHRLPPSVISGDEGVVVSAALAAATGGHQLLRPWTVARRENERITVVGIGDADAVRAALDGASPQAQGVVLSVRAMPAFTPEIGQRLRFEARVCPTVNRTRGSEIDVYLAAVDRGGDVPPREQVYNEWFSQRLDGAKIEQSRMVAFTITPTFRPTHGADRRWVQRRYPDVTLRGVATVEDPCVFAQTLRQGVGRQRAYGRGWVWTEPVD